MKETEQVLDKLKGDERKIIITAKERTQKKN